MNVRRLLDRLLADGVTFRVRTYERDGRQVEYANWQSVGGIDGTAADLLHRHNTEIVRLLKARSDV